LIITLHHHEIIKKLGDFKGQNINDIELYQIIKIFPVSYSESKERHLTLLTENGHRIFITFNKETNSSFISEESVQNAGM
jgi:hypothetical protein